MTCRARGKYSYAFGNDYQLKKSCNNVEKGAGDGENVPKYMGWRWDEPIVGIGDKKWYPGLINRTVRCLMKNALNPFPYDTIPLTRRDKTGRVLKTCKNYSQLPEFNPALIQKPILLIQKRDGEYTVTMNPLKDNKKLVTDCNPFLNCSPLKFKITKKPEDVEKHRAKKILRQRGFDKKCSCLNLNSCRCMSENSKKLFKYEMKNVTNKLMLKNELTFADLDDSSDSELDMQFTTPAAIVDCRKCKLDVVHGGTQCEAKDFLPKPKRTPNFGKEGKPKSKSNSADGRNADGKNADGKTADGKNGRAMKKPIRKKYESILVDPPCKSIPSCKTKCI